MTIDDPSALLAAPTLLGHCRRPPACTSRDSVSQRMARYARYDGLSSVCQQLQAQHFLMLSTARRGDLTIRVPAYAGEVAGSVIVRFKPTAGAAASAGKR
jgi:hypothetical protein